MIIDSIPLKIRSTGLTSFLLDFDVLIDGRTYTFLLDTGAVASSVTPDDEINKYPALNRTVSKGAAGIGVDCDVIVVEKIIAGKQTFSKIQLKRTSPNLFALDLLKDLFFEIDLVSNNLHVLDRLPETPSKAVLNRLKLNHMTIPLVLGSSGTTALFDTGADTTVIDMEYVNEHPESFRLVRSEEGTDAHGNQIPSQVFVCNSVMVGLLKMKDVEMAAFDFGPNLRGHLEGTPVILGNNVISQAKWAFDLNSNYFTCEVDLT